MDQLAIGCDKGVTTAISAGTNNLVGIAAIAECDYVTSPDDLTGEMTWYWYNSDRSLDIPIDGAT